MDNHHAENSCEANIIKDTLNGIIVSNDAICVNQTILLRLEWISIAGNMNSALSFICIIIVREYEQCKTIPSFLLH